MLVCRRRTLTQTARSALLAGLAFASPVATTLFAQEPPPAATTPNAEAQPDETDVPELPETVVPGRPGAFPLTPLDDDSVIAPTGNATSTRDIGSSYSLFTEDLIRSKQSVTVGELLRGSAGLDVVRQGGVGGATSVFLRGANSQQTKVLMDGVPINDPSSPTRGFDFSNLTVDNIERVEVLRGPQSVLYGTDAIGGVINIVTKRGEGPLAVRAAAQGGSFGSHQEIVSASGGGERGYYSISGSYLRSDGISSASSRYGNDELDGYSNGTVSGRFGWNPSTDLNIDYVFRWIDARTEVDDFSFVTGRPEDDDLAGIPGRPVRANLLRSFFQRVQLQSLSVDGLIEQRVGFSFTSYDRKDTAPIFEPPQYDGQTRKVDYQANLTLTENNLFTVGAMYLQEDAASAASVFDPATAASQHDAGVYLQDQIRLFDRWTTTVGVRWDDWNTAGPAETYRIASIYSIDETDTALHGSLGTGFRAPALAENLFAFGNPNLRPERSKGWDVGVTQHLFDRILTFDATWFRNDFRDLIVFDFATFSLENVGLARSSGVEFTGELLLTSTTSLNGSYTFTDTMNLETGAPLLRRPRDKASIGLVQTFAEGRGSLGILTYLVGPRLDTNNHVLQRYNWMQINGRWRLTDHCELFGRIDNVGNVWYEEVYGYGTPGISGFAGANITW